MRRSVWRRSPTVVSHETSAEKGIVSRETLPPNSVSFLIRARIDNQMRNPEIAISPNARLNHRRKAAGLVLRMFRLHEQRPREVVFPHRLVRPELEEAREDRPISRLNAHASLPSQRSAPHSKPENPAMPAPRRVYVLTLLTPNSSLSLTESRFYAIIRYHRSRFRGVRRELL